jgi:hypothetical protein
VLRPAHLDGGNLWPEVSQHMLRAERSDGGSRSEANDPDPAKPSASERRLKRKAAAAEVAAGSPASRRKTADARTRDGDRAAADVEWVSDAVSGGLRAKETFGRGCGAESPKSSGEAPRKKSSAEPPEDGSIEDSPEGRRTGGESERGSIEKRPERGISRDAPGRERPEDGTRRQRPAESSGRESSQRGGSSKSPGNSSSLDSPARESSSEDPESRRGSPQRGASAGGEALGGDVPPRGEPKGQEGWWRKAIRGGLREADVAGRGLVLSEEALRERAAAEGWEGGGEGKVSKRAIMEGRVREADARVAALRARQERCAALNPGVLEVSQHLSKNAVEVTRRGTRGPSSGPGRSTESRNGKSSFQSGSNS